MEKPYKWRFLAGKSDVNGGFSIAMFDFPRVLLITIAFASNATTNLENDLGPAL